MEMSQEVQMQYDPMGLGQDLLDEDWLEFLESSLMPQTCLEASSDSSSSTETTHQGIPNTFSWLEDGHQDLVVCFAIIDVHL